MSKLPDYKAPNSSDYPEADDWIWKVLESVSRQLKQITQTLQKKVDQVNNLNVDDRELQLLSGQEVSITPEGLTGKPTSVEVLGVDPSFFVQWLSRIVSETEVRLTVFFSNVPSFSGASGTVPVTPVNTLIRIWGGG